MNPGDLVRNKNSDPGEVGLFVGLRTYDGTNGQQYTCAEVMWFERRAPNGDRVSTIQTNLLEVINESK